MKQATGFISDAGNHFDSEFEAYKDDLRHKLQEATGNGPMARDAIAAICADLTTWAGALGHMLSIAPPVVAEASHSITDVNSGLPVAVETLNMDGCISQEQAFKITDRERRQRFGIDDPFVPDYAR